MNRNRTIDFLKFVFSILVITVHTDLFIDVSIPLYYFFTMGLARSTVPFFFIVSGFFYRDRQLKGKDRKPYIIKLVKYWAIFICLDLLIIGHFYFHEYKSVLEFIYKFLFCGISGSYWYLTSSIVSLIILSNVFKKGYAKFSIIVGLLFYFFAMTHDSYSFLFQNTGIYKLSDLRTGIVMMMPQAGFGESILFLSAGALLCEYKNSVVSYAKQHSVLIRVLLIISYILLIIEAGFTMSHKAFDGNCYLSLLIVPVITFIWALTFDPIIFDSSFLGCMALYIYLIHPILKSLLNLSTLNSVVKTLLCILISVFLSYICCCIHNRYKTCKS